MVDPVDTEDLYCLGCGYNLRGLPGDPRRCPECGDESYVEEMRWPAEVINSQARKLETWPALSVGCLLFGFLLFILLACIWDRVFREDDMADSVVPYCLMGFSALVSLIGWFHCVRRFRKEAEEGTPWMRVLVEMLLATFLYLFGFGGSCASAVSYFDKGVQHPGTILYMLVTLFLWIAGIIVYRDARRNLMKVRLHTVRELARKEMKQRTDRRN